MVLEWSLELLGNVQAGRIWVDEGLSGPGGTGFGGLGLVRWLGGVGEKAKKGRIGAGPRPAGKAHLFLSGSRVLKRAIGMNRPALGLARAPAATRACCGRRLSVRYCA